jgi:hypothetical protein
MVGASSPNAAWPAVGRFVRQLTWALDDVTDRTRASVIASGSVGGVGESSAGCSFAPTAIDV